MLQSTTLQEIKRRGSKALSKAGPLYIIVNSKPHSVVLPVHEYENLMELLEDYEDILAIEDRKNEKTISWEEMFPKKKAA